MTDAKSVGGDASYTNSAPPVFQSQSKSLLYSTLGMILIVVVMVGNAFIQIRDLHHVREYQTLSMKTTQAIEELDSLLVSMLDAEAGVRGFVITGRDEYLEPYHNMRGKALLHLNQFRELTAEIPTLQAQVTTIEQGITAAVSLFTESVYLARSHGVSAAKKDLATGRTKRLMDRVRVLTAETKSEVIKLINIRSARSYESTLSVKNSVVFSLIVNLLMVVSAYLLLRRYMSQNAKDRDRLARETWLKDGLARLNERLRSDQTLNGVCQSTLDFLASYVGIGVGTFYIVQGDCLVVTASYAREGELAPTQSLRVGQGLVGEVASSRRMRHLKNIPDGYVKISSSLGNASPREIVILPIFNEDELEGIIEMGSWKTFDTETFRLFDYIKEKLGISVDAAQSRSHLQMLLEETQAQSEELQTQQLELKANNEELEAQALVLKQTQERLHLQQEELRQSNEDLEEQTRILENQKLTLIAKNKDLELAQIDIERKAFELSEASRYKSEFLANMSHELRTPLNSMLILSTLLADNEGKNLTDKQVGFAKTIHRSGTDLLHLISDILDLAKVEAGKLSLFLEQVDLKNVLTTLDQTFREVAEEKGLSFLCHVSEGAPYQITTDAQRLEQVLKNFLSNAIKFTDRGGVELRLEEANNFLLPSGKPAALVFIVKDTGIGIPKEKQDIIFEAFQQADGSTSRAYGGTGLGLTISRELSVMLGGKITIESDSGKGSAFSLYLPLSIKENLDEGSSNIPRTTLDVLSDDETLGRIHSLKVQNNLKPAKSLIFGDQENIQPGDRLVLIIEDDVDFASTILDQARNAGFKGIVAGDGGSGLEVLQRYNVHGILLDLKLPDMSGLSILERLKDDPKTRHLPIHVISGGGRMRETLRMGAVGHLVKPVTPKQLHQAFDRIESVFSKSIKRLLVVEDDQIQRDAVCQLLRGQDVEIDSVGRGKEALLKIEESSYDCMILDLRLPDISGFELLENLSKKNDASRPPVVIYTGKDLSDTELDLLRKYSDSIVIKGAKSPERLLDEVSLFLHRIEAHLPSDVRALLRDLRAKDAVFEGRRILIVDDDMRNVFALSSALETHGFKILVGKNGKEGLEKLRSDGAIELVLMDIMMPVMDGYETMNQIRSDARFTNLPIIALTAKAMKGDQERCLEAGANDYLPKPVNIDRLLSLLRVWLPPRGEI